jgi:hypothetical protein
MTVLSLKREVRADKLHYLKKINTKLIIVFRPSLVQGLGSRFWSGHRFVWVNFFKSKQRCFSKKTKVNGCNQVFDRVLPGHRVNRVFPSSIFSSTRSGSSLWSAGFQVDPPGQTEFQNYETNNPIFQNRSIPYN